MIEKEAYRCPNCKRIFWRYKTASYCDLFEHDGTELIRKSAAEIMAEERGKA